jgi:hypothetical protein
MALTEEQIAARRGWVGGSDTNIILGGDDVKLLTLWEVKRGLRESEDLSDVLAVQMGTFTEPFNAQWFTKQTGRQITNQGDERASPEYPFMHSTLDGLTDDGQTVWEAKHVGAFFKEDEILDRYMPQLHHNMIVCGLERAVLSVFFGNNKWVAMEVKKDPIYSAILIGAVEKFWESVKTGVPPVAVSLAAPVEPTLRIDMTGNNAWANYAQQYKDNIAQHKLYESAVQNLKELVQPDAVEAYGHGISLKRDKRGALRIKG